MEETEVCLCDHVASILSETCNLKSRPNRVTGEELVVGRDSRELHHTEFHGHMVDQFLSLGLGESSLFQITVYININKGGDTSNAHRSAVLGLDCCEVAEVQPLDCLFCVCRWAGDIVAVDLCHLLHAL